MRKVEQTGLVMAVVLGIAGCDGDAVVPEIPAGPRLVIASDSIPVPVGRSERLIVYVETVEGDTVTPGDVVWESADTTIATVPEKGYSPYWYVTGVAPGTVRIVATAGELADTTSVTVYPFVESLRLVPDTFRVIEGATMELFARAPGQPARTREWRPGELLWESSDSGVAQVDGTGAVLGISPGEATISTTYGDKTATASVTVRPPVEISTVSVGSEHVCALSADGSPLCWGEYLGLGTATAPTGCSQYGCYPRAAVDPLPVPTTMPLTQLSASESGDLYSFTCGLEESGKVVCWGSNHSGQLGTAVRGRCELGHIACALYPVNVDFPGPFTQIETGAAFACAIRTAGTAECWGNHFGGPYGGWQGTASSVLVEAPAAFESITAAWSHACGLTADGRLYCWGRNEAGQLGNDAEEDFEVATRSQEDLRFASVDAGYLNTCGLTADGAPHCWGSNANALASGAAAAREMGLTFHSIDVAERYFSVPPYPVGAQACGITAEGKLYCWGLSIVNGVAGSVGTPMEIAPGYTWRSFSGARDRSCGVTTDNELFCWQNEDEPARVAGQR